MAAPFSRILLLGLLFGLGGPAGSWAQNAQQDRNFRATRNDPAIRDEPPQDDGRVRFLGAKAFNEQQLREAIADPLNEIKQRGLTKPRADDTAYLLAVYYRKQGYAGAEVAWEIRGSRLVLTIKEGPRTYLRKIHFQGNQQESDATLYDYMIGQTEERLTQQGNEYPFVAADMQTGVARIRGLYESLGRLDAVVEEPVITYTRDKSGAEVTVKITEGPRYTFGEVSFAGETTFRRDELVGALGEPLHNPFTTQRLNTMEHNLQYWLKARGYYAAEVESQATKESATAGRLGSRLVPVVFTIRQGPLYRFDGLKVISATGEPLRTQPEFLHNRFRGLTGQVYDPVKLDEHFREVLRTGIYSNLRINTVPLPDHTVRIELTAEEAKPKELGFSIGFSSYEGFIFGARVGDRNFMGNGRPLTFSMEYSQRASRAELLYVDPWWFESDFSLRTRLFLQGREEEGYAKRETGARMEVTHNVTPQIQLGLTAEAKSVEITEAAISPEFLGLTAYQVATLGFTQSFDYRDSPVSPTRGWIINTSIDAGAIANELAFGRATARFTYYLPIMRRYLLALGARGGLLYPLADIPIDERFFNGGSTTVRSFAERDLGPHDGEYPIGGQAFTVFNAEFNFPIRDALVGAVFADAGNLIGTFEEASLNELRYAVGVGLRYKLPVGPVRLDVGLNPTPKRGESWGAVHFSFGFAF